MLVQAKQTLNSHFFKSATEIELSNVEPIGCQARIDSLTGLRFLAALHVVLFHEAKWVFQDLAAFLVAISNVHQNGISHRVCCFLAEGLLGFGANGPCSVSFFFVLSGFILTYTYHEKIVGNRFSRRNFWIARFARIYPVYLLGLIILLPFVVWSVKNGTQSLESVLRSGFLNVALIQSWFPKDALSWNGPGWSLSAEAFFYFIFAFFAPFLINASTLRVLVGSVLFLLLTKCIVALLAAGITVQPSGLEWRQNILALFPLLRLSEFTLGMAVGIAFLNGRKTPRHTLFRDVAPVVAAALCLFLLAYGRVTIGGTFSEIVLPLSYALVIYSFAFGGSISTLFGGPMPILLGEASYAVYILHIPIARYFHSFLHANYGAALEGEIVGIPAVIYITAVIGSSVALFKWLESPAKEWIKKQFGGSPRMTTLSR